MPSAELRHVGIVVQDLSVNKSFWLDGMGFEQVSDMLESGEHIDAIMDAKNVIVQTVKLRDKRGLIIELLKFVAPKPKRSMLASPFRTGITHVAITVDDLNYYYEHLTNFGGKFHCSPQYSPDASVKFIYCRGPENIIIELVQMLK